jgi:hypothetical protein
MVKLKPPGESNPLEFGLLDDRAKALNSFNPVLKEKRNDQKTLCSSGRNHNHAHQLLAGYRSEEGS